MAPRVVESAGIQDILSKCLGSTNKYNVVHATVAALQGLRGPEVVAKARGKELDEISSDYPISAVSVQASGGSSIVSGNGGSAS